MYNKYARISMEMYTLFKTFSYLSKHAKLHFNWLETTVWLMHTDTHSRWLKSLILIVRSILTLLLCSASAEWASFAPKQAWHFSLLKMLGSNLRHFEAMFVYVFQNNLAHLIDGPGEKSNPLQYKTHFARNPTNLHIKNSKTIYISTTSTHT